MDQLLSNIIPTQRIGDNFQWWVGQIEQTASKEKKNKGGYRFKVRIVGDHPGSTDLLKTDDLPWANVMMPVNVPFMPGNTGGAHPQLEKGCWVVGFFMDSDRQKPIIMGSIGQTPGATSVVWNERPTNPAFTTYIPSDVNPATDGQPAPENPQGGTPKEGETKTTTPTSNTDTTNKSTGGLSDNTQSENSKGEKTTRVDPGTRKLEGDKQEKWCQSVAEKCDKEDIKTKTTILLGEFLAEVQNNNGKIGTYLVGQATGGLYDAIGTARTYVNKFMFVIGHFVAKVKGFVIEKLTEAVKALIKALLNPKGEGNSLTPVTEFFNNLLKELGCSMADLGKRLEEWLTNVLMSYLQDIYSAVACQVDALVNGIMSKMNSLMEELLSSILGPLQEILGAIAAPLNILGDAINYVLNLLGISCSGPDNECAEYKSVCTDGEKKEKDKKDDFLDNLLKDIDNLFPSTGADYTQYVCEDAYKGNALAVTTVGFTGGVQKPNGGYTSSGTSTSSGSSGNKTQLAKKNKITYSISDITVEEGEDAIFTVTRTGYTEISSSVKFKTLKGKGTAEVGSDYLAVDSILGFAPNETSKNIIVKTLFSTAKESDEYFYLKLKKSTPTDTSGVPSYFESNIAKCTITEKDLTSKYNPYAGIPVDPFKGIENTFPDVDQQGASGDGDNVSPTYNVTADKSFVEEGGFVIFNITTTNLENGTILYYTMLGNGITQDDIIGAKLNGSVVIDNNQGKVTVGINDDGVVEDEETLRFTLNGTGAFADVLITTDDDDSGPADVDKFDEGTGPTIENNYLPFEFPVVNPQKIITDDNGGIIQIPVENKGDPWAEPPYVFIGGAGLGAAATALLDQDGFLTEIRVKASGYGYKKNLASDRGVRCIIDTFSLIRPGRGYTSKPDIYINGELGVAETIINEDGFVIGARVLDRSKTYESFPEIILAGGGGYGAKLIPSLVCLDTEALTTLGSTKIGTGRYVDCP